MNMDRIESTGQLTAAREAAGMTIEDVAHRLRLAPRQVVAIESGEWSALPGVAFARGVLRSYGRLLGVDVEPLVAEVAGTLKSSELREVASLGQPLPRRSLFGFDDGGRGNKVVWAILAIVGVLALALFFGGGSLSSVRSWLDSSEPSASTGAPPEQGGATDAAAASDRAGGRASPPQSGVAPRESRSALPPSGGSGSSSTVTTPVPIDLPQGAQSPPARVPNRNRE